MPDEQRRGGGVNWAAEAVTRGDLYAWAIVLMIHMWYMARYLAFVIRLPKP